jgi:hypothetical protein
MGADNQQERVTARMLGLIVGFILMKRIKRDGSDSIMEEHHHGIRVFIAPAQAGADEPRRLIHVVTILRDYTPDFCA